MTFNHDINYRINYIYVFFSGFFYHGACASTFTSPEGFPFPYDPDRNALSAQPIYKRHCSSWNHSMLFLNRVSNNGNSTHHVASVPYPVERIFSHMSVFFDDISATRRQPRGGFIFLSA